jgi:hypothetical protein
MIRTQEDFKAIINKQLETDAMENVLMAVNDCIIEYFRINNNHNSPEAKIIHALLTQAALETRGF